MFETSMMMAITDSAMNSPNRSGTSLFPLLIVHCIDCSRVLCIVIEHVPGMWNDLAPNFLKYQDQINSDLKAAGLQPLVLPQ